MVERLASPAAHELDALTDLWERSVRVTHDFLAPEDIPFFRRMVRQEALPAAEKAWGANSWSTSRSIAECDAWM